MRRPRTASAKTVTRIERKREGGKATRAQKTRPHRTYRGSKKVRRLQKARQKKNNQRVHSPKPKKKTKIKNRCAKGAQDLKGRRKKGQGRSIIASPQKKKRCCRKKWESRQA